MNNKIIKILFCLTLLILLPGCMKTKSSIDKDFRKYLEKNYNLELAKKSEVGKCHNNCDYYGYYPLSNDLTYKIQISKTNNKYQVTFDHETINLRRELYDYIKIQKGNNFVNNYLVFDDNGDKGHISSSGGVTESLEYIVYYDNNIKFDEQLYSDYLILQKANNLLKRKNSFINHMTIHYIENKRIKKDNWLENLNINVSDYNYVLYESFKEKDYIYKYNISSSEFTEDLGRLSFEEFKKLVYSELKKKQF